MLARDVGMLARDVYKANALQTTFSVHSSNQTHLFGPIIGKVIGKTVSRVSFLVHCRSVQAWNTAN